jgi:hypothetical protein
MVAMGLGLFVAGAVVMLLYQAAKEEMQGLADTTVEQCAYTLQAKLTMCLRGMSSNQGLTPNYGTAVTDANGDLLGYSAIYVFLANTNGTYTAEQISFDSESGQVLYTPNVANSASRVMWSTNGLTMAVHKLYFSSSFNPDGSQNNSLVNVTIQMDDNGFSGQNPTNNPASICRNFSIKMRSD